MTLGISNIFIKRYICIEEYETCAEAEFMHERANLIEEFYRFDSFDRPKGINLCYKWNKISSKYFCKKAPFTLITKEIMEIINKYHNAYEALKEDDFVSELSKIFDMNFAKGIYDYFDEDFEN